MEGWNRSLAIFGLLLIGTLFQACISFRGNALPRYRADRLVSATPAITAPYDVVVIVPVPSKLARVESEKDVSRAMFLHEIQRIFSQAGIQPGDDRSSGLHVTLTLYIGSDVAHSLAGHYYGYLTALTLGTFPYHEQDRLILEAEVQKGGQPVKRYRYEQVVHTWSQLLLMFALPFYDPEGLKLASIDDLLFNFILEFQRDYIGSAAG